MILCDRDIEAASNPAGNAAQSTAPPELKCREASSGAEEFPLSPPEMPWPLDVEPPPK
jgi:hypothetical protein